ncbi:ATP-dependent helicase HrpB [Halomonas sp. EF61]|uniref:ATP-dependent helicase HrpB n=1 Tax=Halomonas sp. EF61 TaxID=2950869 RepID=UPI0032E04356
MSSPPSLPIDARLPQLTAALEQHNRALLVAEPGAGKTTRVPLALLDCDWCGGDDGRGRLLLLEPRRVAARLAAGHMAELLGERPGETVGYRMRGESRVGPTTRLEVVTQGVLSRMLQHDPMLEGVTGILFDEFHERSLEADLGLALALDVQQGLREDLRLVVMSATLDVAAMQGVLGQDVAVIECPGRQYPVQTLYRQLSQRASAEEQQGRVVMEALQASDPVSHGGDDNARGGGDPAGDVLVILPGVAEIERLGRWLGERLEAIAVLPLHGRLPLEQQRAALRPDPNGRRRVVLATAIAESSVTVDGVRSVVDAGLERVPVFSPRTGLSRLETRRVNRASADQRRGRAGRQGPGRCYRLWAEEQPLPPHAEPEIHQADLSGLAFELARWGVKDASALAWVTSPGTAALDSGRRLLQSLGLVEPDGGLSSLGRAAGRWPVHPRLAAMLERASRAGEASLALACALVAWLEGRQGASREPDLERVFVPLLSSPRPDPAWQREAWRLCKRAGVALDKARMGEPRGTGEPGASIILGELLLCAYPDRVAQHLSPGRFRLRGGGLVTLASDHPLAHAPLLVAVDLDGRQREARLYRGVRIEEAALLAHFPELGDWTERVAWNASAGRLEGERVRALDAVVLERKPLAGPPSREARHRALLDALGQREALPLDEAAEQLRRRVALLRRTHDPQWPELDDASLMAELEDWLGPHLDGLSRLDQVLALPWERLLRERLPWPLAGKLDELAPRQLALPSGDSAALRYEREVDDGDEHGTRIVPVLAAKLQALFGCEATPCIVDGRVPVRLELLSPARRPLATTMDLRSFWHNVYPEVRKENRGRYPKHPWPEDPLAAEATMRTKRRGR